MHQPSMIHMLVYLMNTSTNDGDYHQGERKGDRVGSLQLLLWGIKSESSMTKQHYVLSLGVGYTMTLLHEINKRNTNYQNPLSLSQDCLLLNIYQYTTLKMEFRLWI